MKKELTYEQKEARAAAVAFKKKMNRSWKLRGYTMDRDFTAVKDLGKAPKCSTRVKVDAPAVASNQGKKRR